MEIKEKWIKDTEVSEITGIARQTLINKRRKKEGIPFYRDGRSVRYKLNDVLDYMERRRVEVRA